jgi:hypothetical protein
MMTSGTPPRIGAPNGVFGQLRRRLLTDRVAGFDINHEMTAVASTG